MLIFKKKSSDTELLAGLCTTGSQRILWENRLYERYFYFIREGVFKHRLSEDEVASVYSDTVISVIENIQNGKFERKSELKTYIYQIFSNKCVDVVRKKTTNKASVNEGIALNDITFVLPDESKSIIQKLISEDDLAVLREKLLLIGEKCYQILLHWGEGFSDEEIAVMIGYHTAQVAKTSRLRCLEKLRELYFRLSAK